MKTLLMIMLLSAIVVLAQSAVPARMTTGKERSR
jgi:hypothetical protein